VRWWFRRPRRRARQAVSPLLRGRRHRARRTCGSSPARRTLAGHDSHLRLFDAQGLRSSALVVAMARMAGHHASPAQGRPSPTGRRRRRPPARCTSHRSISFTAKWSALRMVAPSPVDAFAQRVTAERSPVSAGDGRALGTDSLANVGGLVALDVRGGRDHVGRSRAATRPPTGHGVASGHRPLATRPPVASSGTTTGREKVLGARRRRDARRSRREAPTGRGAAQ